MYHAGGSVIMAGGGSGGSGGTAAPIVTGGSGGSSDPFTAAQDLLAPADLDGIPDDTMLAVAAVPGKVLEEWRHSGFGVWIAWPHATDAVHAEEMTAGQLRALLAARDCG